MEELSFILEIQTNSGESYSFTINDQEVDYILQQVKYNQPFVLIVEEDVYTFSPMMCLLHIKPEK